MMVPLLERTPHGIKMVRKKVKRSSSTIRYTAHINAGMKMVNLSSYTLTTKVKWKALLKNIFQTGSYSRSSPWLKAGQKVKRKRGT